MQTELRYLEELCYIKGGKRIPKVTSLQRKEPTIHT